MGIKLILFLNKATARPSARLPERNKGGDVPDINVGNFSEIRFISRRSEGY